MEQNAPLLSLRLPAVQSGKISGWFASCDWSSVGTGYNGLEATYPQNQRKCFFETFWRQLVGCEARKRGVGEASNSRGT